MNRRFTLVDYVAFGIIGVVALIALLYVAFGWTALGAFLVHPATASWVQALGSIAAVGAGAAGIYWQVKRQEDQRREDENQKAVQRLQFIGAALFDCRVVLQITNNQSATSLSIEFEFGELRTKLQALSSIPAFDLPDWRAHYAIATAVSALKSVEQRVLAIRPLQRDTHTERLKYLNAIENALDFAEGMVRNCLWDRAADLLPITYLVDGEPIQSASVKPDV